MPLSEDSNRQNITGSLEKFKEKKNYHFFYKKKIKLPLLFHPAF